MNHETHICRDCGAEIRIPYAAPAVLDADRLALLQEAYDLIMLLAFAKPEAAIGLPKTFALLDRLRIVLARPPVLAMPSVRP